MTTRSTHLARVTLAGAAIAAFIAVGGLTTPAAHAAESLTVDTPTVAAGDVLKVHGHCDLPVVLMNALYPWLGYGLLPMPNGDYVLDEPVPANTAPGQYQVEVVCAHDEDYQQKTYQYGTFLVVAAAEPTTTLSETTSTEIGVPPSSDPDETVVGVPPSDTTLVDTTLVDTTLVDTTLGATTLPGGTSPIDTIEGGDLPETGSSSGITAPAGAVLLFVGGLLLTVRRLATLGRRR